MIHAASSEADDERLVWRRSPGELKECAEATALGRLAGRGMVVQDAGGEIVAANVRAASILGLTRNQLLGLTSRDPRWEAVSEQGFPLPGDQHPAMRTLATGEPVEGFLMGVLVPGGVGVHPDPGETRWIEIDALPVRSPSDEVLGVVTLFRDVSGGERGRRAIQALIRSYRLLAENASDIVLMSSDDSRIVWISSSVTRLLGWAPEELSGRLVADLLHPDDLAAFAAAEPALALDEFVTVNGRVRTADGQYRCMAARIRPLRGGIGPVGSRIVSWRNIEAEHRALEALQESEERLRLLAENADDIIWTMDLDGRTTFTSPSVERVLGFTPDEVRLQRTPPMDAASEARWQHYWAALQEAIATGAPPPTFLGDIRHIGKDGRTVIGEVRIVPQSDATGRVVRILGVTRDVTEVRTAAEEAARSRAELAEAQRIAKVGSWTVDLRSGTYRMSDESLRIAGLEAPSTGPRQGDSSDLWQQIERRTSRETAERVRACQARALETGHPTELEYDMEGPDGQRLRVHSRMEVLRDDTDEVVGLRGTLQDVTDLHAVKREAAEREARSQLVEDAAVDAFVTVRADGRIVGWNPAAERMYGYTAAEAIGLPVSAILGEEEREQHLARYRDLLEEAPIGAGWLAEGTALRADGTEFPTESSLVQWEMGGERFYTVMVRDITERRAREAALRQADADKNRFISSLSHELRNPLGGILLALGRLRDLNAGHEEAEAVVDVAERQSQLLARLVDDLLDVTRMTHDKVVLQKENIELNDLVVQVVQDNRTLFGDRIELGITSPPIGVRVEGDSTRLAQAIGNLLHNAVKFSPPGAPVMLSVERDEVYHQAVITVRDRGRGIPADLLPVLFEPFVQADEERDRALGGLGLGLSIVRQIAELHGGTVAAASDGPGLGSQFTLRLPLATSQPLAPARAPEQPGPGRGPLHIVLIEDDEILRELMTWSLVKMGHRVASAGTGPEGVAVVRQSRPDVVLCDIGLPGLNGFEVARILRGDSMLDHVHLIAVTGYGQPDEIHHALTAGFDRHVTKPVNQKDLEDMLAELSASSEPA